MEFGNLFQGLKETKGMNVCTFIGKGDMPKDKKTTHSWTAVAHGPEKVNDPNRTRIAAGGDHLEHDDKATTHVASLETIKTHWNSVISTPGAKCCTGDVSNICLESLLLEADTN